MAASCRLAMLVLLSGCDACAESHRGGPVEREDEHDSASGAQPPAAGSRAPTVQAALTPAQARCLELDQPACAGCHSRQGLLVLRPVGVPPSPPGTPTVPVEQCLPSSSPMSAAAGSSAADAGPSFQDRPIDPATEIVVSSERATCLGLDQKVCAICHKRQNTFLARPSGAPPHPDAAKDTLERCP